MRRHLIALLVLAGCSTDDPGVPLVAGFSPPPAAAGYERFIAPGIKHVAPNDDLNYCQWVADPSDVDRQVVDFHHYQTVGGHHMVLYATSKHVPVGTSEICSTEDMLSVNFLGGGEGSVTSAVQLPGGYAFDLPAGMSLMVNAHYLNATDDTIDVQSVADVKFGDPQHPLAAVGFIAVNWDAFTIPANSDYTSDAYCTATDRLSFFMWGNHMHQYGAAETSELIHPDASVVTMEISPTWTPELTFNTPWVNWDPAAPFVVNPGDVFHLSCTWHNGTDADVLFPTEMCVATGFVLEAMPQAVCAAEPPPQP